MNGFALIAESYRKVLDDARSDYDEQSPELAEAERKIEIFNFLATCDQNDFYTLVDSSAFNEIIKDFIRAALKNASVDDDTRSKVMNEVRWLFSEKTAKQICEGSD